MTTRAPEREFAARDVQVQPYMRRALLDSHGRIDTQWLRVWDEATSSVVEKAFPLPQPICGNCREPWGDVGCTTVRVVLLLGVRECEALEDRRRIAELTEALTPAFHVERRPRPENDTMELRMVVDRHVLLYGGIGVADATLRNMRDEWRAWFKKVGDLERIRADHAYALTLGSDYYVYLTQEFNANAPFVKQSGEPWPVRASRLSTEEPGE